MCYMIHTTFTAPNTGFTNQIFTIITGIILAIKLKHKVLMVDQFVNDISKKEYTPISKIINLDALNLYLKKYGVLVADKCVSKIRIEKILFGTKEKNYDLTTFLQKEPSELSIPISLDLNLIQGDPCYGIVKNIFITYRLNDEWIEEEYSETRTMPICIGINQPYYNTFGWINRYDQVLFEEILQHIEYHSDFVIEPIQGERINVIHLRLEKDGIAHWSKMNHLSEDEFTRILENRYIELIQKYILKTDTTLLLSQSLNNGVVNFLKKENYSYTFTKKQYEDREKNAIVDLLTAKACNHIYIGNFNPNKMNGSSFSYYVGEVSRPVKKLYIDLDHIMESALDS